MRYESSQALQAHTDLITVIAIRLFMPAVITGIKFVDFKSLLYIVLNQIITVVITVIVLHCSSTHFNRGESYVRQTKTQRVVAKVMEFSRNMESSRSAFSPLRQGPQTNGNHPLSEAYVASATCTTVGVTGNLISEGGLLIPLITRSQNSARFSMPRLHILLFSIISLITRSANFVRFLASAANW